MAEEERYHPYCMDCGRMFGDNWGYKNEFLAQGDAASCSSCGGVVKVLAESEAARIIAADKKRRGIG